MNEFFVAELCTTCWRPACDGCCRELPRHHTVSDDPGCSTGECEFYQSCEGFFDEGGEDDQGVVALLA